MDFIQDAGLVTVKHTWRIDYDYSTEELDFCWRGQVESDVPSFVLSNPKSCDYRSVRCGARIIFSSSEEFANEPNISDVDIVIVSSKAEAIKIITKSLAEFMLELKDFAEISDREIIEKSVHMSKAAMKNLVEAENMRLSLLYCNPS